MQELFYGWRAEPLHREIRLAPQSAQGAALGASGSWGYAKWLERGRFIWPMGKHAQVRPRYAAFREDDGDQAAHALGVGQCESKGAGGGLAA